MAAEVDESCGERPEEALWRRSATAVLASAERPSPVAWVEDALARARATELPGFVSCGDIARDDAARLQADADARSQDVLYGVPILVDGSLCSACWRRWGVASGLSESIRPGEVVTHPVTECLALRGAVLVGVSNAGPGVGSGAVAAVACGNAPVGIVVDTTCGAVLGTAAAAGIVALHPTPATIPHTIDPDGEHFAALHWHATLLGHGIDDIALLYDGLYAAEGWGNAGVCPPPRLSLAGGSAPKPSGPPGARSAVSQGRAAAEGGGVSPPRGFNRTAVPKTAVARQAQALPARVAWSVELSPGHERLATVCQAAAEWFEGVGARVDKATPALSNPSTLLQRCHGTECRRARCVFCNSLLVSVRTWLRASLPAFVVACLVCGCGSFSSRVNRSNLLLLTNNRCVHAWCARTYNSGRMLRAATAHRQLLYPSAMAILALTAALTFAPIDKTDYSMVEAVPSPLSFWLQLTNLGHGVVFKGQFVTVLLGLVGCCLLAVHYAIGVVPPLWLAGLDVDAQYADELRPAYNREERHQHRQLHMEVGEFFAKYDLLCTVIPTEEKHQLRPTVGHSNVDTIELTVPAVARMMCCPAVTLPLYGTGEQRLSAKQAAKAQEGKGKEGGEEDDSTHSQGAGQEFALMLIGRPFGEDALIAASAVWADAHPPPAVADCQQHSPMAANSARKERSGGVVESTNAGPGTRLVARVVCSPGWRALHHRLQWVIHLVTQRVATAYNGQRLHGTN